MKMVVDFGISCFLGVVLCTYRIALEAIFEMGRKHYGIEIAGFSFVCLARMRDSTIMHGKRDLPKESVMGTKQWNISIK